MPMPATCLRQFFSGGRARRGRLVYADAMRVLGQQPVDVIVSDIEMPDADGYQFLQRAQDNQSWRPAHHRSRSP